MNLPDSHSANSGRSVWVADVGNQRTKIGRIRSFGDASADEQLPAPCFPSLEGRTAIHVPEELQSLTDLPDRADWLIASVNHQRATALTDWLSRFRSGDKHRLITNDDIPMATSVRFREKLGVDRLLAAWAAKKIQPPEQAFVVVDAGTAVTIDAVDRHGIFLGGNIFPGLEAALSQLRQTTFNLPLVELKCAPEFHLGRDTIEAIQSGVFHSQIGAIRYLAEMLGQDLESDRVFLTGGAMPLLRTALPDHWRHEPDLVLTGLAHLSASIFK